MNPQIDNYLAEGCGRCSLGGTLECKVHNWSEELQRLRKIALETKLTEELKWGVPCYTFDQKNIALISAFKEFCAISFFKGALMKDPNSVLQKPGESSQATRMLKFTHIDQITKQEKVVKAYFEEAIEIEKSGRKIKFKKNPEPIPSELQQMMDEDITLKNAFEALTPGRQRGYIIHFSQPKQSQTRIKRIQKCIPKIMNGEGMHDAYKAMRKE
ncbi:MAG: YdeI/OmpD-associated family protein [Cyclobacteriaceae bacterium]